MYFQYGQEETEYLSGKDEKLGAVIAQVGRVNREVDTDLFSAVVHHIVGQQISTKAQATIWQRMRGALGTVDAEHILEAGNEQLQLLGISCRKAEYITDWRPAGRPIRTIRITMNRFRRIFRITSL